MTKKDHPENGEEAQGHENQSAAALSAAAKRAQQALESAKELVAEAHLDEVGAKAAAAASNLYREGRDRLRRQRGAVAGDRTIERRDPQEPARRGRHRVLGRPSARASDPRLGAMRKRDCRLRPTAGAGRGCDASPVPAALGIIAGVFFLFAVAGLFAALFFWLEPMYGPAIAAADRRGGRARAWAARDAASDGRAPTGACPRPASTRRCLRSCRCSRRARPRSARSNPHWPLSCWRSPSG